MKSAPHLIKLKKRHKVKKQDKKLPKQKKKKIDVNRARYYNPCFIITTNLVFSGT